MPRPSDTLTLKLPELLVSTNRPSLLPCQLVEDPSYKYDTPIISNFGLGYRGEGEEKGMKFNGDEMDFLDFNSMPVIKKKDHFLMIGGVKVYTEDTSPSNEGEDGFDYDGKSSDYGAGRISSSDESNSFDAEEEDDNLSDYLEGIGDTSELLDVHWLTALNLDESDKDGLIGSDNRAKGEGGGKLGENALTNASKEYGMKKHSLRWDKGNVRPHQFGLSVVDIDVSGLEDLLFVKDSRTAREKRKHKW